MNAIYVSQQERSARHKLHLDDVVFLVSAYGDYPATGTTAVAQDVKTRIADGFTVQVTPFVFDGAVVPDHFEISVTDPTKVTAVTAALGTDLNSGTPVALTTTASGWTVNVPKGTTTGSGLLLKFSLANGDSFETGLSDFSF